MALSNFYPHRCGNRYWDVWDWPQSVFGQHFGIDLDEFDDWMGSKRQQLAAQRSGASEVKNDENKFSVKLDCSHFKPEEITVKTVGNNLVINGKHEEKMDKHGWIQREFTRRYALPEGCEVEKVVSNLASNGMLSIEAPKKPLPPLKENERVVPIAIEAGEQQKAIRGKK
jgi:crystallin alpha B